MVYHYTTIEVLYNMLASYKLSNDKKHITFWASNALDQNDTQEMPLKYDELQKALSEVEYELEGEGYKLGVWKLSNIDKYGTIVGIDFDDVVTEINQAVEHPFFTPYTISFSHKKDTLLMWSMYANNGNGVCLAFDERKAKATSPGIFSMSDNVIYNKDKERYKNVLRIMYKEYLQRNSSKIPIVNCHYVEMRSALRAMLGGISPFIKNKAFKDEKEWRISNYIIDDDTVRVNKRLTHKLNFVNFLKVDIPLAALRYVVIGPCANFEKVRGLLINESLECGIKKMGIEGFYKKSQVPYREI